MSLEKLNAEQRAAVLAPEARVLVLAGAGSGKTRTLVERVAHLISQGASAYEIVCVTFTRAAATEMRERLTKRIGPEARKVIVSTLHGLGLSLLKQYGTHIGLRYGRLSVYTPLETAALLEHCGEMLGLYKGGKWKDGKRALDAYMAAVERGEREDVLKGSPFAPLLASFEAACIQNNAMPYYALIHGLARLAEDGIAGRYTTWKYFLVDEAQDLDMMQWQALESLLEHSHSGDARLYAVGDISQSIYSFRGAVPEHLQALIDAQKMTVYELRKNYRSMPSIVRAANNLIRHNSHRVIDMEAVEQNDSHAVDCTLNMDSAALAELLSTGYWCGSIGNEPCEPGMTVAVLCRNNRMLDKLSAELTARGTSHLRIGRRTNDLHSALFVKANALLKCLANPYDETAFLLAHKALGVDAQTYADLGVKAAEEGKSRFEVYAESLDAIGWSMLPAPSSSVEEARQYFELSGRYTFDPADGNPADYLAWLATYAREHPCDTIDDYLDWIALADVQDELPAPEERPGLVLMTCHAAKGLEFPYVFIAGCNEGVMPGKQAITAEKQGNRESVEDERRIMYVAVTRAQRGLVLAVRPTGGKLPANSGEPPSRFLAEMDIA